MSTTVLVIDDMPDVRLSANFLLSSHNYQVLEASSPLEALEIVKQHAIDLILLDMNYQTDTTSGQEGLDFLNMLNKENLNIPVVAMTGWSTVDVAVKAMQQGANDFIEKPWDNQRLLQVIKQQIQFSGLKKQNQRLQQHHQKNATNHLEELVWQSSAMSQLMTEIERLAQTDATILLTGENGTGKSSIANLIHQKSSRHQNNLVTVNMGAIPDALFESEMFGHKKGAFTDAKETRMGRFEMANEGTLFLDEIANIPLAQQAKLLRVLETSEFEMVGSSITQQSNIRLISASNADFEQLIASEKFRPDLYYRLNTIELHVPALRERIEDIMPLARHFVNKHSMRYNRLNMSLSGDVEDKLTDYLWPGNIRELSHMMERAVLLSSNEEITANDIPLKTINTKQSSEIPFMTLDQAEQQLLKQALNKAKGSAVDAAQLLGISKSAIYRRMEKYDIKS
ncbi:MAG: sigma-54-dependent Fis family transcriptional regulator [Colwellia sp.]|nr:sigma-54-dependent Fis family transcriptional regulator [Colwellia sp.]